MNILTSRALLSLFASFFMALPAVAVQEQPSPPKQPIVEPVFLSPPRTWNTKDGKHNVVARLEKIDNNQVVLKRVDNGRVAKVPIDLLSEKDVTYLKQLEEQKNEADAQLPPPVVVPTDPDPAMEEPMMTEPMTETMVPDDHSVESPKVYLTPLKYTGASEMGIPVLEPMRSDMEPTHRSEVEAEKTTMASPDVVAAGPDKESSERIEDDSLRMPDFESLAMTPESIPTETQPDIGGLLVEESSPIIGMTDDEIVAAIIPSVSLGQDARIRMGLENEPIIGSPTLAFHFDGDTSGAAWRAGFMELDELVDQDGNVLSVFRLPPTESNLIKGWVAIDSGACVVPIETQSNPLQSIDRVRGTLKVAFVTDSVTIEIPPDATDADLKDNPILVESGITISMRSPNVATLHLDVSGSIADIVNVSLVHSGNTDVKKNQSVSRRYGWYQFTFSSKVPPDTVIRVQIARDSREVTVPFDFQDVGASQ